MNSGIRLENIRKKYGKKPVLRDITLSVERGTAVGILGGNGSGKSTLLQILAGTTRADGGQFLYTGESLFAAPRKREQLLGYVPQGMPLFEELTGRENLRLWYSKEEMAASLEDGVLALLSVGEFLDVKVSRLSGGMQKRLAIGCAVAHRPEILLLDEPSAALDLPCKEKIAEYLRAFKKEGGTVLLATHDVLELSLCDALYILKDGVLTPFSFDGDVHRLVRSL